MDSITQETRKAEIMFTAIKAFFTPPIHSSIERTQKARFLHFALFVTVAICVTLGALNPNSATNLNLYYYLVAVLCLIGVPINQRGHYTWVAVFISAVILVMLTFSLVTGIGLKDAGLIAYPLFIIFSSYLFGKKAVPFATLSAVLAIAFVYSFFKSGHGAPIQYSEINQFYVILVLLAAAGFLLWVVIENWEHSLEKLHETYDLTLSGWGQTLEFRDRETQGHSRNVVAMTLALSSRLGIKGEQLDTIRHGALLHDIGKMAIPDAILLKPGTLTQEEWDIMKRHPLDAKVMLEKIPFLTPALAIPLSHHERWDGTGYPQGLSGEDIPQSARIFAVVDVWDALLSDRPYRKAWTRRKALAFIREQSGKGFDPQVVKVFLEYLSEAPHSPTQS